MPKARRARRRAQPDPPALRKRARRSVSAATASEASHLASSPKADQGFCCRADLIVHTPRNRRCPAQVSLFKESDVANVFGAKPFEECRVAKGQVVASASRCEMRPTTTSSARSRS